MATLDLVRHDQAVDLPLLTSRSRHLALLQMVQIGTGFLGQTFLLTRWSPNAHTDLFLLLSGIPWLVTAIVLVGGLEMMLPSVYHGILANQGLDQAHQFLQQISAISLLVGLAGTVLSAFIITIWAWQSELSIVLSLWMGLALGLQVLVVGLGSLWRGLLIAHDRLVQLCCTLLAGSILTLIGYAILPSESAVFLPAVAAIATLLTVSLAWHFSHDVFPNFRIQIPRTLYPNLNILAKSLLALGFAAGLVHIQAIIERAALLQLETGMVTAFTVAGRGWEAVMAIVVAAAIMPVYPHWAEQTTISPNPALLRWSMIRATGLSIVFAFLIAIVAVIGLTILNHDEWQAWRQTLQLGLALLPRFILLATLQPLILKHYAQGKPYLPVLGALLGVGVISIGALTIIPQHGIGGIALTTAASVLPGWIILAWHEWRQT